MNIPDPIFKNKLTKISWKKIYEREYGVQYSEAAVGLLAFAKYHFPVTSFDQVVIPGVGNNTAFYIDESSWNKLVGGLNKKYTSNIRNLEKYEKQFLLDGRNYISFTKKISTSNLSKLTNKQLLKVFLNHQDKKNRYSVFAWTGFILNHHVADRATAILEKYIKKHNKESEKQELVGSMLRPDKRAAIHQLQYEVEENKGKLSEKQLNNLYERFKWLSCLDIHNKAWTKTEFKNHIKSFTKSSSKKQIPFSLLINQLKISKKDLQYLMMAKKFAYNMDARDDFRREGVYYAGNLFKEIGIRMGVSQEDTSYLLDNEIFDFLNDQKPVLLDKIKDRKKGFVLYIDVDKNSVCLQAEKIQSALKIFRLADKEDENIEQIKGRVASKGKAKGKVVIIKGVSDIKKVKKGNIMVAVTTHPDFVPAMRICAAIVTDEGGITSHAAIVSREFGIPCIVGTKVATKLLNDGDVVEVDAEAGIVKKLS